jgi:hypothetical protein
VSEIFKRLKQAEKKGRNSVGQKVVQQDIQAVEWNYQVRYLQDVAVHFNQTMADLGADMKAMRQETSELKRHLEVFQGLVEVMSQDRASRDNMVKEVKQSLRTLTEQMKAEIEGKATYLSTLEKGIENLKVAYHQTIQHFDEDEILNGLTDERRVRTAKKLLGDLLPRSRPIQLNLTCPRCKGKISKQFRLRVKAKERDSNSK